jgi:putative protease
MPKLDDYLRIGVDSLKVEGRGKSEYYAAIVARAYRMAIDDYYEDPENWTPHKYMRELESVGNRGYTLAFHDGRLSNYSHDYEQTEALAQWEYAGVVTEVTEDAFHVAVKNKLEAGEVLDFVSPISRETVLLRMYEFELVSGEVKDAVHGGAQATIKVPFSLFDHEDLDDLKARFPVYSVLRKEKALTTEQWNRVKFDKLVQGLETGGKRNEKAYEKRRDALAESVAENTSERRFKTNRVGVEGCCGKGCNGCLIFWEDDTYARAREALLTRKHGEQLSRAEAKALKGPLVIPAP